MLNLSRKRFFISTASVSLAFCAITTVASASASNFISYSYTAHYGGTTFDPKGDFIPSNTNDYNVFESGNKVSIVWAETSENQSTVFVTLYLSTAKNNKWIILDKPIYTTKDPGVADGGHYYAQGNVMAIKRDVPASDGDYLIDVFRFSPTGLLSHTIVKESRASVLHEFLFTLDGSIFTTNEGLATIESQTQSKTKYTVTLLNSGKTITFNDPHNLMRTNSNPNYMPTFAMNTAIHDFYNGQYSDSGPGTSPIGFNYISNNPIWNASGQMTKLGQNPMILYPYGNYLFDYDVPYPGYLAPAPVLIIANGRTLKPLNEMKIPTRNGSAPVLTITPSQVHDWVVYKYKFNYDIKLFQFQYNKNGFTSM